MDLNFDSGSWFQDKGNGNFTTPWNSTGASDNSWQQPIQDFGNQVGQIFSQGVQQAQDFGGQVAQGFGQGVAQIGGLGQQMVQGLDNSWNQGVQQVEVQLLLQVDSVGSKERKFWLN